MCLAVPGIIKEWIDEDLAWVSFGSVKRKIALNLLENPEIGDWVLVHAGFAVSKVDPEEAQETLAFIEEVMGKNDEN